jgi:hypothetical protein
VPKNLSIRNILTEKHLAILGEIACASAQLESTTGFMLMLVLQFNEVDQDAIVGPTTISTRPDVFLDVLK